MTASNRPSKYSKSIVLSNLDHRVQVYGFGGFGLRVYGLRGFGGSKLEIEASVVEGSGHRGFRV